jgi:hypothetical protein
VPSVVLFTARSPRLVGSLSTTPGGYLWTIASAQILNDERSVLSTENTAAVNKRRNAIRLLRSWREANDGEQQDTWEFLERALDEDRPSERKLFS